MSTRSPEWSIELLRGIAAFMVLATHYHELAGWHIPALKFLHVGVDLFFVISGYVFAPYLFGKPLRLRPFFVRRWFRVYPLYLAAVFVYACLRPWEPLMGSNILKHLLFLHTFESREVAFSLNSAFWSLPPEVEFYLFLPVLAPLVASSLHRLLMVLAIAVALRLFIFIPGHSFDGAWMLAGMRYHVPGLISEFVLGGWAWWWSVARPSAARRVAVFSAGLLLLGILGYCFALYHGDVQVAGDHQVPAWLGNYLGLMSAGAFALIVAGVGHLSDLSISSLKWVALGVGELSYGVYLFHNAAPLLMEQAGWAPGNVEFVTLCLLLTLVASILFHVGLESPLRRFGRDIAWRWA